MLATGKKPVATPLRKQASVLAGGAFKNGFHKFAKDCTMRAQATEQSAVVGRVRKGKRLWVDGHSKEWVKVFKKSGPVYLQMECIE